MHGGHFIALSSAWRTVTGAIHCFFQGRAITDAEIGTDHIVRSRVASLVCFLHKTVALGKFVSQGECIHLQRRSACHTESTDADAGHVPVVDSPESLQNILLLACGVELQDAITRESYIPTQDELLISALELRGKDGEAGLRVHDISSVGFDVRCRNVTTRGRMKDYVRVLLQRIIVRDEHGCVQDPWTFLFVPMMAWMICALQEYYRASFKNVSPDQRLKYSFIPDEFLFRRQLRWVADRWKGLPDAIEELDYAAVDTLIAPLPVFTVNPVAESPPPGECIRICTECLTRSPTHVVRWNQLCQKAPAKRLTTG